MYVFCQTSKLLTTTTFLIVVHIAGSGNYEYMKIMYVNCGVKNYLKEDHRSYLRKYAVAKRKPEKSCVDNYDDLPSNNSWFSSYFSKNFPRRHGSRFQHYAILLFFINRKEKSCLHSHACWEGWNVNGNRDHHASYTRNSRVFICSRSRPQLGKWRWYKGKSKGWWVQVQGHRYCLIKSISLWMGASSCYLVAYHVEVKQSTFKLQGEEV